MSEKFYVLTRNLLLSIAFSCIVFVYYGRAYQIERYYIRIEFDKKIELSKTAFNDYSKNQVIDKFIEITFNTEKALEYGLKYFGLSFLLLFIYSSLISISLPILKTKFNL